MVLQQAPHRHLGYVVSDAVQAAGPDQVLNMGTTQQTLLHQLEDLQGLLGGPIQGHS
jgi:hypothetical protein